MSKTVIFETEKASIIMPGGTVYLRLSPTACRFLDVERTDKGLEEIDLEVTLARGRHGNHVYIHSPKQQKQFEKDQKKELQEEIEKNQA